MLQENVHLYNCTFFLNFQFKVEKPHRVAWNSLIFSKFHFIYYKSTISFMTLSFWESSNHHHLLTPLSYGLTVACMFNCHTKGDAQKYGNYVIVTSHITSHVFFRAKPRVALIIRAESRPGKNLRMLLYWNTMFTNLILQFSNLTDLLYGRVLILNNFILFIFVSYCSWFVQYWKKQVFFKDWVVCKTHHTLLSQSCWPVVLLALCVKMCANLGSRANKCGSWSTNGPTEDCIC